MKTETVISLFFAVVGTALWTCLLMCHLVGQDCFVSLMGMLSLVCLVIPVLGRLRQLDLKNLKLTLQKMEQVKKEVFAKEEDLKKISLLVSELLAFNSAFEGRAYEEEPWRLQNRWYYSKVNELLSSMKVSSSTTDSVLKYTKAFRRFEESTNDARKKEWHDLMNMIRKDIGEPLTCEEPPGIGCTNIGLEPLSSYR